MDDQIPGIEPDPRSGAPQDDSAIASAAIVCWHLNPDAIGRDLLSRVYARILSPRERARHEEISDPAHRAFFLAGRCLARLALAERAKLDPRSWRFGTRPGGKPTITKPLGLPFRINLSHTDGLVVCAVATGCEIGVDVERLDRPGDLLGLARRLLAACELDDLRRRPSGERRHRFLEYWTLKEAYLKARGLGLSLPPRQLAFSLGPRIRLISAPVPEGGKEAWEFVRVRPTEAHTVAIAVAAPTDRRRRPNAERPPVCVVLRDGIEVLAP